MSDAFLSSAIMLLALALFESDRIRPDAVALRPGNYRFMDYPRVGAPLSVIAMLVTAYMLSRFYG